MAGKGLELEEPVAGTIRVATYNVSLHRRAYGELSRDLEQGDDQAERLARIIRAVRPDILLANEVDYDGGRSAELLLTKYFGNASAARPLRFCYSSEVNTGLSSGLDLNGDGRVEGPGDAWGFGAYPGQYGLAVFSRFPIDASQVQSFQKFLWSHMPGALRPKKSDGTAYWPDAVWSQLRLSSKTHLDIPISIDGQVLHLLVSHPTPPVFDGEEDRNGCRNHDEIRLLKDYATGGAGSEYLLSDQGRVGPLPAGSRFVILGDLNADPVDGDGQHAAITALLASPRIRSQPVPRSQGGVEAANRQGGANRSQVGDPGEDTGDFNDSRPGNLRCDFVLPSIECEVVACGVYWPSPDELAATDPKLLEASDHRLVWVDLRLP
jgi:endonuclease/exonuclease/phosphatase family metal-dependent hydrolase